MQIAFIALGSNLGDRLAWLQQAVVRLHKVATSIRFSPVYEGTAHTLHPEDVFPDFLNAVVEIHTDLGASDLLDYCQEIELKANRQRYLPYAPRTLDLDILVLGEFTCSTDRIILPHPRLEDRRFVLQPWYDLAPNSHIPSPVNATVAEVLAHCKDKARLIKTPWLLMNSAHDTTLQGHHAPDPRTISVEL